ncbi:MAG: hypothetical protein U0Q16_30675 [Bryobacteraceae bacterium]
MSAPTVTLEQLPDLREKTERVSEFLSQRLRTHLATIYPILAPKRIFGKYLGSKETVSRADEAYQDLGARYREAAGAPFDLRTDLDEQALASMEQGIEIYPWTYSHEAAGRRMSVTAPFRWAVTYKCDYTLAEMQRIFDGPPKEHRSSSVRHFVTNALAAQVVLARSPGARQLLEDLRYQVKSEPIPGLGKLTMLTLSPPVQSFLPADEVLSMSARLSGVSAFIEVVDPHSAAAFDDPLRAEIGRLLA